MDNLPVVTSNHITASLAVTTLQKLIEKNKWVFRRQAQDDDFGVDAEIEIVDRNLATGTLVKCQIKGTANLEWENGYERVRIKTSTYNNWKNTPLPVIVFLVDTSSDDIFWVSPFWQTPKKIAKNIYLKFYQENKIDKSLYDISDYISRWKDVFSFNNCLNEIKLYSDIESEIKNQIEGCVPNMLLDDLEDKLYSLYKHILQLRVQTSLSIKNIISYDDWLTRNAGIWGIDGMYYGTAQELLTYIGPYYEKAKDKAKEILRVSEESLTNYRARVFLLEEDICSYPENYNCQLFHNGIEKKLITANALKFEFKNKVNKN